MKENVQPDEVMVGRPPALTSNGGAIYLRSAGTLNRERAIDIWRAAVDATHDFLTQADRAAIEKEVCELLPHASLWLAVDERDHPLGFMLMEGSHVGGLFIDPPQHGRGIGRMLIHHALRQHFTITV